MPVDSPSRKVSSGYLPILPFMNFQIGPEYLAQPINPGWSFGNYIINYNNSTAPNVEQAILNRQSYGRQIGRLIDVVRVLVKKARIGNDAAAVEFEKLAKEVDKLKEESKLERQKQLLEELKDLKKADEVAWNELMWELKNLPPQEPDI